MIFLRRHQSANSAWIAATYNVLLGTKKSVCMKYSIEEDFIVKIKQIIPVPQGRKYYAVFTDENSNSGYYAERVDFIVVVRYGLQYILRRSAEERAARALGGNEQ